MPHRLRRRAMALLCRTRLYRYTLAGRTPREFVKNLAIRWPGDAKRGAELLAGDFHLAGQTVRLAAPYAPPPEAGADWLAEFHGFSWLADLATLGSAEAREIGRVAIATWIADNANWHELSWRSDVLAARLVLRTQHSARLSLLLEAAIIVAAATGVLGIAAVPVLAASMALQNEAVTHGIVALNVGFITGDLQTLGERLIPAAAPGEPRKRDNRVWLLLTILVFYAAGAAIGALLAGWDEAALILPAALLATAALLPERWTGLAAERH